MHKSAKSPGVWTQMVQGTEPIRINFKIHAIFHKQKELQTVHQLTVSWLLI